MTTKGNSYLGHSLITRIKARPDNECAMGTSKSKCASDDQTSASVKVFDDGVGRKVVQPFFSTAPSEELDHIIQESRLFHYRLSLRVD